MVAEQQLLAASRAAALMTVVKSVTANRVLRSTGPGNSEWVGDSQQIVRYSEVGTMVRSYLTPTEVVEFNRHYPP